MEKFVILDEILDMYCISRRLVREILRHNKIDFYKRDEEIYINLKEFYKIYTAKYNPALFNIDEQQEIKKSIIENKLNRTFFNIFSEPINCKQNLRNLVMAYAE